MIDRLHNTDRKIGKIWDVYQDGDTCFQLKPNGLWYGMGEAWLDWCRENMPGWVRRRTYRIEVDESLILTLRNKMDVQGFVCKYGERILGYSTLSLIRWDRVARAYAGIEIINYWDMALVRYVSGMTWFYSWDCDSGCVWDMSAVKKLTELEKQRRVLK